MVLRLPSTTSSLRGLTAWLRILLSRTSGWLKACLRLVLALAYNASTHFRIIEGNDRQMRTSVSSWASSCSMQEPVMTTSAHPNYPASCSCSMPKPDPNNLRLAIIGTYTTSLIVPAEVQDENQDMIVPTLKPILASHVQEERYERHLKHTLPEKYSYPASPGVQNFSEEIDDDSEWQAVIHPEGALFFYGSRQRIITEANIQNEDVAKKIKQAIQEVGRLVRSNNVNLPVTAELVLGFDEGFRTCGYYLVDHDTKSLFWAETHEDLLSDMFEDVPATNKTHIKYAYEKQYWIHCDLFPNKRIVQADIMDRLKCAIMYAYSETVTSESSLAPYNADDLNALMTLIGPINDCAGNPHEHSICIIARLMQTFTYSQFINFCGQPEARLDVDKPLYNQRDQDPPQWKVVLLCCLNVALFGSLQSHKKSIERVWVDDAVVVTRWKNFFDSLKTEWIGFTVFSTVMLAVDVGLLALPEINPNSVHSQPASQIMAYLSTLCSMGSLIASLILASQIQILHGENAEDAVTLFCGMSKSLLGLDGLAVIHSLPFAFLLWAMIFFLVGLSAAIFHSTDSQTLGVIGAFFAIMMTLIIWTVLVMNNLHISSLIKLSDDSLAAVTTPPTAEASEPGDAIERVA